MISVDNRAGSSDLAPLLRARGLPVTLTRLPYGDVSFMGEGPEGRPVTVGIEVKTIHDALACMCDGRFAGHQLPGMVASYEQPWLLVEGLWRGNAKTGLLEYRQKRGDWREAHVGTRRFMLTDLYTWLFTLQVKGGIQFSTCSDWGQGVTWLSALYHWWTKGWDRHKSHLAFHDGTRHGRPFARQSVFGSGKGLADKAVLTRPTTCRQVAAQLPGVGWDKSARLAKMFPTVADLIGATVEDMQECEGIGPILAQKVYDALRSKR